MISNRSAGPGVRRCRSDHHARQTAASETTSISSFSEKLSQRRREGMSVIPAASARDGDGRDWSLASDAPDFDFRPTSLTPKAMKARNPRKAVFCSAIQSHPAALRALDDIDPWFHPAHHSRRESGGWPPTRFRALLPLAGVIGVFFDRWPHLRGCIARQLCSQL